MDIPEVLTTKTNPHCQDEFLITENAVRLSGDHVTSTKFGKVQVSRILRKEKY
jgi:hypothetical protein